MGSSNLSLLILSLFLAIQNVSAGNGVIGFGLSLYQDECCQACFDSLSALYLTCTTFANTTSMSSGGMSMGGMDMGGDTMVMGTTTDECYATNAPWLQTMAYCIKSNCDAHGYPADKQATCFSAHAVGGASTPTFQESLPSVAPTVELEADAMWLNVTSLVNADTYSSTYGTQAEFARSEYIHTRYSLILYLITIGSIIAVGLLTQARAASPGFQRFFSNSRVWAKLQQYIFLPALFGARRVQPLPGHIGYLPGRTLSISITLYVIINVVLSSVSYDSFQPNIYWASTPMELCEYVGNRTGILSMVNMSMAILFAGRNNLLILLTGWSQTTFMILHRWTARVATVQAVVHSIVYTLQFFTPAQTVTYSAKVKETFYWVGIVSTIAMCLAAGIAALPIRVGYYETFLITHIALVIATLVTLWYHLIPHFGFDYGYQVWLYICFAFWGFDRFVRVARMVYYNHVGCSTAIVEALPGCDVLQVTLTPRVWRFGPGQHSYLYLPDSSVYLPGLGAKFWENHPFSVAGWRKHGNAPISLSSPAALSETAVEKQKSEDITVVSVGSESGRSQVSESQRQPTSPYEAQNQDYTSIQLLIRVRSGMTASLKRRVLLSPTRCAEVAMYTEGPYAGHRASLQRFSDADTILVFIGGIGVTAALGYVQEYASARSQTQESSKKKGFMNKATRFILAWSAREMALIEHVKSEFLAQQGEVPGLEFLFWCTGPSHSGKQKLESVDDKRHELHTSAATTVEGVTAGRMDIRSVMRASVEPGLQTTVLVCGPGNMIDEATREVVGCINDGLKVDLVDEAFGW